VSDEAQGFHGWGTEDWALHVGRLPGRKSICLYERDGSAIRTLAFFRSDEDAQRALRAIDRLTGV
jgi:hypothetical protein